VHPKNNFTKKKPCQTVAVAGAKVAGVMLQLAQVLLERAKGGSKVGREKDMLAVRFSSIGRACGGKEAGSRPNLSLTTFFRSWTFLGCHFLPRTVNSYCKFLSANLAAAAPILRQSLKALTGTFCGERPVLGDHFPLPFS
jgi:hypothetical protein